MKILCGIPFLYGYGHSKNAIESVLNQMDVDLLFIDNGGDAEIKRLALEYLYDPRVAIIRNKENIFVNPAWNQIIKYFLDSEYELLCIMNSDLVLNSGWSEVVRARLRKSQNECFVPKVVTSVEVFRRIVDPSYMEAIEVNVGLPGIFFTLTKEQAKIVYPIPTTIKVWFGDNWIFNALRKNGHKTIVPESLVAMHGNSQTVSRLPGISEIIEQDKIEWEKITSWAQ